MFPAVAEAHDPEFTRAWMSVPLYLAWRNAHWFRVTAVLTVFWPPSHWLTDHLSPETFRVRRVCCVVTGGNVDPALYASLVAGD